MNIMKITLSGFAKAFIIAISLITLLSSCDKKNEDTPPSNAVDYSQGFFVVNEGPFNTGTGTITWFNHNGTERVPKLFQLNNNLLPLGNLAQSMTVIGGYGFIVVNNANTIWSVALNSFMQTGSIDNINLPRYIADAGNGKAYISSWDNKVYTFDPQGLQVTGEVNTGTGPEKLIKVGEQIWVLNQGGFSIDSTITVIDIATSEAVNTIQVYPKPTGIQIDKNGLVWVLCSGSGWNGWPEPTDSEGHLVCIDPANENFVKEFEFPNNSDHPEKLEINAEGDRLFYNYPGGIYSQSISSSNLDLEKFAARQGVFYSLGYDPKNDVLYGADAMNFTQEGWIFRYDGNSGTLIDSLQAGIGPTGFCFPN